MATKTDKARVDAKRAAVVARLKEAHGRLDTLAVMWDEKALDTLVLAFGIGRVELDE